MWSRLWRRLVGRRPIVTRLVVAVAVAMTVVLLAGSGFVYWRVEYALSRQLDQDLTAWTSVVDRSIAAGGVPPQGTPGLHYQVYDEQGRLLSGSQGMARLATPDLVRAVVAGADDDYDVGALLPPPLHAYRVRPALVSSHGQQRVVLAVISRAKRDEALRELMLQLALFDLGTLVAASFVGYRTARAALNPVEAYRRAAAAAQDDSGARLPVAERDDELTRLGHTFNSLLERIAASSARERQFLADAAHELRTPLTLMTAELDWATARQRSPEQVRETLTSMRGQVSRLVGLANALLDLEEIRAVRDLDRRDVLVADLLHDAARDALPHGTDVRYDVPADLEGDLDPRWLTMAVANLLGNAHRHGSEPITVRARRLPDGLLEVVVRDAGPGFPPDFRPHAFDRFSRAEESRTTPGSGLGLHLALSVAEAHGGTAEVLDGPGGGVRLVVVG